MDNMKSKNNLPFLYFGLLSLIYSIFYFIFNSSIILSLFKIKYLLALSAFSLVYWLLLIYA